MVVAAGNSAADSCGVAPGNSKATINVAASDLATKFGARRSQPDAEEGPPDGIYQYSNTGACVDLFAPGVDILAACGGAGGVLMAILGFRRDKRRSSQVGLHSSTRPALTAHLPHWTTRRD